MLRLCQSCRRSSRAAELVEQARGGAGAFLRCAPAAPRRRTVSPCVSAAHARSAPRPQLTAPQGPGAGSPELTDELIELLRADRESAKDAARAFRAALDGWDNQALMFTLKARAAAPAAWRGAAHARRGAARRVGGCAEQRLCC